MIKFKDLNEAQKEMICSNNLEVVFSGIKQGFGIDRLINHSDYRIRICVAQNGYGEEILRDDKVGIVRAVVLRHAKQQETIDKLSKDTNRFVVDAYNELYAGQYA